MKKLFLIITTCVMSALMSAQVNYYVETTGSDVTGDGSEAAPFASVSAAFGAVSVYFASNTTSTSYVVNVGEGTFTESDLDVTNSGAEVLVSIVGQGADKTIIQGADELSETATKMFATPSSNLLQYTVEDLTIQNYGATSGATTSIITMSKKWIYFTANRCVFRDIQGSDGALFKTNHAVYLTLNQCSFLDINGGQDPIINLGRGYVYVTNSMFSNCVRDYTGATEANDKGIVIHSQTSQNWATADVELVNNTFVDCGVVNGASVSASAVDQSLVKVLWDYSGGEATVNTIVANNLFCGNALEDMNSASYYDLTIVDKLANVIITDSTNNIFTAVNGLSATGNYVNDALTYTSSEVDFDMDGSDLAYTTADNGLVYVTAHGTEVVDKALASVQPLVDIIGTTRSVDGGCVGAVEYVAAGEQFISFPAIDAVHIDNAVDIVLEENSSAGLPITYVSSDESVATIVDGNTLHPVAAGVVTITASQSGDATYSAADDVEHEVYFAADTAMYYLRPEGDDTNSGLTLENAVATLPQAASLVVNQGLSYVYVIDVDGEITSSVSSSLDFNRTEDIVVMIQGAAADQTIYKMAEDADFDAIISTTNQSLGRMFSTVKNTGAGNISLEVTDMSFRNFGFTNSNGGAFFNLNAGGVVVNVAVKRCNFENGIARSGALVQANNGTVSFSMEDCFVGEMIAINNNTFNSPIVFSKDCSFSATNCVFSHFVKAAEELGNTSTDSTTYQGNVISFTPSTDSTSIVLINNTFIGDSSLRTEAVIPQATVLVYDSVQAQATIANNLFIGGGATTTEGYYNVYFPASGTVFGTSSNNVMLSQSGFSATGNDINDSYTYDDAMIEFVMDGDYPQILQSSTGVRYVRASGSAVDAQALASVAPEYDIAGNLRSATPSVGACESDDEGVASLYSKSETSLRLYPNPVQGVLNVDGEVSQLSVYNIAGQLVRSYDVLNGQVDLSSLTQGLYLVGAKDAKGVTIAVHRLIKQ